MFENSDDYDFAPSGSSKLASLFDGSILSKDTNSDLTYTAPKQPKTKKDVEPSESAKSKTQSSVVQAKVISLWKLEDTDYKSLGKHGLAIIGSVDLNLFEIISYKEKNNIILRRKINSSFNFYNQKDCFSSFYDNENRNWLVKFNSIEDQNEFCREIKSRGANVVVNVDPTPLNRTVTKESIGKPDLFPRESAISKPEILPRLSQTLEKDQEDANSDSSDSHKRANILFRMAKMGQQILPSDVLKSASTDISDSELDDSKTEKIPPRKFKRAVPLEKHVPKEERLPQHVPQPNQVIPTQNLNQPLQYPQQNVISSYPQQNLVSPYPQHNVMGAYPPHMLSPVLVNQAMSYDSFQQYIVSQNTDLKMNLAQISAKLDTVLNVGTKSDIKTDDGNLKSKIKTLELRSENLLTELERYEKMYDDLQSKCKKLEKETTESESNKSVIETLNKQIENLKENLKTAEEKTSDYEKLKTDLEKYRNDVEEYLNIIETQKSTLQNLEEFYEENKDNSNLQETVDTLNDTVTNLKLKLKDFEEHFLKTEAEKQKRIEENEKTINTFSDKIKDLMNNMYQSILAGFEEGASYSVAQIRSQVAVNLKGTTFAIIKEFKDTCKTEGASIPNQ